MTAKSRKARNRRFNGHGNVNSGGRAGWQLTCSRCGAISKVLHTRMSPDALIKKFIQLGWDVGANQDICPQCLRKTITSHMPVAKQAIKDMLAPMAKDEHGKAHHVSELKAELASLPPEQLKDVIKFAREHVPAAPKREKKPPKATPPEDPDYEKWLSEPESE